MAIIERVEILEYVYEVRNMSASADLVRSYDPKSSAKIKTFALRITDADGAVGEYCAMHIGKRPIALAETLMAAPVILRRDGNDREKICAALKNMLRHYSGVGASAIDIALWDLMGKRTGQSVSALLGRYRHTLAAYASTLPADKRGGLTDKGRFGEFARHCQSLGYRGFKIHGWKTGDRHLEAENVRHVRAAVGDGMDLMYDGSSSLITFADALHVGRACDDAGYFWLEDPYGDASQSANGGRQLREALKTPILIGEQIRGLEAKADLIASRGTDLVRADPEYDLGITGTMKIAHLAEAFGMDVELHACGPAHRHCMAAIRNTNYYELSLVGPGVANPVPPVFTCGYSDQLEAVSPDGSFPVPDGPGLGVAYDWPFIEANLVQRHEFRA